MFDLENGGYTCTRINTVYDLYILTARTTCIVSHIFGCWRNRVIHKEAHQKESSGRIQQCTSLWKFDRYITTLLLEKQDNAGQSSKGANKHQAAIDIREATQRTENKMSWPPHRECTECSSRVRFILENMTNWKQRVARWRLSYKSAEVNEILHLRSYFWSKQGKD